ncbi:MAG: hypothetical protein WA735_13655 [Candidatus Acidiferrales bacterium]
MPKLRHIFEAVLCILILGVRCAPAQQAPDQTQDQTQGQTQDQGQTQPLQPIPAIRSPLASAAGNDSGDQSPDQQRLEPDTNPLAGAQDLSLGEQPVMRNNWQPHLDLSVGATSNALELQGNTGWTGWAYLAGGVDLHRFSGVQHLFVNYTGGGIFSIGGPDISGVYQALNLADQFKLQRFTLTFLEQFSYAPEASLGAGGFEDLGGSLGLGSSFTPSQGLLTAREQNVNNTFLTQADVLLSGRSSLTFVGGYLLLHYFNSGNLSYDGPLFRGGYNYQMTRKDTIALIYQFSGIHYTNFDQSIDLNTVHFSYGRRVTGRLAFQVAAGPEIARFQTPIGSVSTGSASPTTSSTTQIYWSLESSLRYAFNRTNVAASYSHGVSGGGGVLAGALADTASGSVDRQWTRTLNVGGSVGYSRNSGLGVAGNTTPNHQTYDYWFGRVEVSHPWGRDLSLRGSYDLQYQTSNSSFCVGVTCGTNVIVHRFSFGVGWRRQPIPF